MKKLAGIGSVDVSLNEGTVILELKRGNRVTVEQVREIIRKNGFTPKDAIVTVAGRVIERNGRPALQVTGIEQVLLLTGQEDRATAEKGQNVVVTGRFPEKDEPAQLAIARLVTE